MLDRMTDKARRLLVLAQEEARAFGHPFVGTEHLLISMATEEDSATARLFSELGVEADSIRDVLREIVGEGQEQSTSHIPLTVRVKQALMEAARIADPSVHQAPITVIHVLLGVLSVNGSVAVQVLETLGIAVHDVRTAALYELARVGITVRLPNPEPEVLLEIRRSDLSDDDLAIVVDELRDIINTLRRLHYKTRKEQERRQQAAEAE